MDLIGWAIVAIIVLSAVAIVLMARRRSWNADGADDERRRRGPR